MNQRRIIIIAIGIAVLALIGVMTYFITRDGGLLGDSAGTLPEIGADFANITTSSPELAEATIAFETVTAYRAFSDGSVIAVDREGKVSRISGTSLAALSSAVITDFASASFSPDGKKILVLTGRQPRSQVNIFDVDTASWRVIPGSFRDATWGPSGVRLATLTPDPQTGKTTIGIYDTATGRTVQTVTTLSLGDVSIAWPATNTIVVTDKPNSRSTGSAWTIDIPSKQIRLAARGKQGFSAIWDSSATRGIALETRTPEGRGGIMSLFNNGVATAKLAFATIPEKCTFASLPGAGETSTPYVICAVPQDQDSFQRAELPDSWLRREFFTNDIFVGVNLNTRDVDFSIAPPLAVDATRLQLVGTTIYYTDRITDKLYKSEI